MILTMLSSEPTVLFMALTVYSFRRRQSPRLFSFFLASSVPWSLVLQRLVSCPPLQTPRTTLEELFSPHPISPSRSWVLRSTASSLASTARSISRLFWSTTLSPIRRYIQMLTTRLNPLIMAWRMPAFPRVTSTLARSMLVAKQLLTCNV